MAAPPLQVRELLVSRRVRVGLGAVAATGLAVVILSFSDKVPNLLRDFTKEIGLYETLRDGAFGLSPWTLGHVGLWAAVTFVLAVVIGHRRAVPAIAALSFGASLAVEVLQNFVTYWRRFQVSDVVGNGIGVVIGATAAVALLWAIERWHRGSRPAPVV